MISSKSVLAVFIEAQRRGVPTLTADEVGYALGLVNVRRTSRTWKAMEELAKDGLVELVDPNRVRYRDWQLTPKGKDVKDVEFEPSSFEDRYGFMKATRMGVDARVAGVRLRDALEKAGKAGLSAKTVLGGKRLSQNPLRHEIEKLCVIGDVICFPNNMFALANYAGAYEKANNVSPVPAAEATYARLGDASGSKMELPPMPARMRVIEVQPTFELVPTPMPPLAPIQFPAISTLVKPSTTKPRKEAEMLSAPVISTTSSLADDLVAMAHKLLDDPNSDPLEIADLVESAKQARSLESKIAELKEKLK